MSCNFSLCFCLNSLDVLRVFLLLSSILFGWTRFFLNWRRGWRSLFLLFLFLSLTLRDRRLLWRIIRLFNTSSRWRSIWLEIFFLLLLLRFRICFSKGFIYSSFRRFPTRCTLGNQLKQFVRCFWLKSSNDLLRFRLNCITRHQLNHSNDLLEIGYFLIFVRVELGIQLLARVESIGETCLLGGL